MSERPGDDEDDKFLDLAEKAGWKCEMCGNTITLADKEAFFASGKKYCSRCAYKLKKDE